MDELPIDAHLAGIVGRLKEESSLVLVAAPGAGKTTRVGPAILRGGVLGEGCGRVIMLQPRRVAAVAAAMRIAEENGWRVGEEVGYQIRFEKRYGKWTKLVVLTEAILTRMLLSDPYLEGVGCVILDEFHERNLHTDLAVGFLREIQQTVRPELKIVVMSATLDAGAVAGFLGGAAVVEVAGRAWPVEVAYRAGRGRRLEEQVRAVLEEVVEGGNSKTEVRKPKTEIRDLRFEIGDDGGDVFVFLPGVGEIERVRRELAGVEREGCVVMTLHGGLSSEEQQRVLRADAEGRRKVILATNIAETSLTIDGVRTVVDSGWVRLASFDADRGMDRLDLERISRASATQRAGRAGRQGAGRAYRLWAETEQKHLAEFNVPEVQRVDLAWTVLAVHAWGAKDVRAFGWFERPSEEMLVAAERLLEMLGGIQKPKSEDRNPKDERSGAMFERGWEMTECGRRMLGLPVHPRVGRMLLAAGGTEWLGRAVNLAAGLSDDSRGVGRASLMEMAERVPGHLERVRRQIFAVAKRLGREAGAVVVRSLEELLLLAYPDRVARRRGADVHSAVMVGGVGLRLMAEALTAAVAGSSLFLAVETFHDSRNKRAETMVRAAVAVEEGSLERMFPGEVREVVGMEFDVEREKVVAARRRMFGDLVLAEDLDGKVDGERAGAVLAEALGARAGELFWGDEGAGRVMARVGLVRQAMGEEAGRWPVFDEGMLRELLAGVCAGKRSMAEVREGGGLLAAVKGVLVYPLDRELERLAPETIEVPSGSRIRVEYAVPGRGGEGVGGFWQTVGSPILAVRLQELFGWRDGPRVCGGRVAVVLHLLSPGFKAMQITTDLGSFWRSAYFEVRKDLRVRYPKHKWPEDPLTAVAEAKGRGRR